MNLHLRIERWRGNAPQSRGECVISQRATDSRGRSQIRVDGRIWIEARHVWTKANGQIPASMCVCHRCDNRRCINLDHLFLGTHTDNMRDMASKGRGVSPLKKLSDAQVQSIRLIWAHSELPTKRAIARLFGISNSTATAIINRKARSVDRASTDRAALSGSQSVSDFDAQCMSSDLDTQIRGFRLV